MSRDEDRPGHQLALPSVLPLLPALALPLVVGPLAAAGVLPLMVLYGMSGVTASVPGWLALRSCTARGLIRDDAVHLMGLLISFGLVAMAVADFSHASVAFCEAPYLATYSAEVVHGTGVILWLIGVLAYCRSVASVLPPARSVFLSLTVVALFVSLSASTLLALVLSHLPLLHQVGHGFYTVTAALLTVWVMGVVLLFRNGLIGRPLLLVFPGMLALLASALLSWPGSQYTDVLSVSTGMLSYILVGAGVLLLQGLVSDAHKSFG